MLYGPDVLDSDTEDGFSDDCDYYDFKEKIKPKFKAQIVEETQEAKDARRLRSVFFHVTNGDIESLTQELDQGLNVDAILECNWTPLQLACTVGKYEVAKLLIERGADLQQTRENSTLLMLACDTNLEDPLIASNIIELVKFLIERGLNPKEIDRKRRTAFMLACSSSCLELVQYLLPLSDIECKDNQKWTALFYAVDNDRIKVVEYLLEQGAESGHIDLRGSTIIDLAKQNGFDEIVELFPVDEVLEQFYINLTIDLNFEEHFTGLKYGEKPIFLSDICKILYGCRCESTIENFSDLSLFEILSLTDDKLKELGIIFPYQRRRLLGGIYKFHKHVYLPKSVPFVPKNEIYSNLDVASEIITCIKQVIAMEAALKFINDNCDKEIRLKNDKMYTMNLQKIHTLKAVTKLLVKSTEMWDSTIKPVDLITKKRKNIPWGNLVMSLSFITVSSVLLYKYSK